MGVYFLLISVVLVPVVCARLVAGKLYGPLFGAVLSLAGITFLVLLLLINEKFPFASGGDDLGYFDASHQSLTSLADWFDTTRYASSHEQAGYPLLLSWVQQVSGPSLFHLKAVNIFFMLQLAVVWFAIGNVLGGKRVAFIYACGILLATPLWFYWLFLLKDLAITLLQSVFVLGLILFVSHKHRFRGCVVIALSTVAVIPFRSLLAVLNFALIVACTFLHERWGSSRGGFGTRFALAALLVFGLWLFSSQPGMMASLGVQAEDRSLTAEAVVTNLERAERDRQPLNPLLFPLLFLVGETGALNPENWGRFDLENLRPLSMVPWIFLGFPIFVAGVGMMLRQTGPWKAFALIVGHNHTLRTSENFTPQQNSILYVLLAFIVAYAGLGWFSGATVRWTLPAIPPMIGIAGFAWAHMDGHARLRLLSTFDFSFATLIIAYYLLMK